MRVISAMLVVITSACGGGDLTAPDGGSPDAAAADAGPVDAGEPGCTCVALGVDFANGVGTLSSIKLPSLTVERGVVAASSDPVVRVHGGKVFIVNRFGQDNVTVVDPVDWSVLAQFSTGAGSNPQDIAVKGTKGYVATLGAPSVQVWNLDAPTAPVATIDLSSYDTDGNPDAASIAIVGDLALVTLGRFDAMFQPRGVGKVVVIDTTDDQVDSAFDLAFPNPFGFLVEHGSGLLVPTAADFSGSAGCLERIQAAPPAAAGCLVENAALGGYVSGVASGDGELFVAVSWFDSASRGKLVRVGDDGAVGADALAPADQVVTDVAACAATKQLVYADSVSGGLRVLDWEDGQPVTQAPLDLGLPASFAGGIACF